MKKMLNLSGWGNDGLSSKEVIDMIQELVPNISREAAQKQMYRYGLP